MRQIDASDFGQEKERVLGTSIKAGQLSEQEKENLVKRALIGNEVRKKLFETVRERLMGQLEHPSVRNTLHSIDEIAPYDQLDTYILQSNITLSERAFHSEEPYEALLHTAIDIAQQKYTILDRMSTLTDKQVIQSTLKLHEIVEIAEGTLIDLAKTFSPNQSQRDVIETKQAVVSSGDEAHKILRQVHDADALRGLLGLTFQAEKKVQSLQPNEQSIIRTVLQVEEKLSKDLEELMKTRDEKIDKVALFRKIAANIRKNANVFFRENSGFTLRINQLDALKALMNFLEQGENDGCVGYFKQPTGAGKTVLYGAIARLTDLKTLILVPRTNLLSQTRNDLIDLVGIHSEEIGLVGEDYQEIGQKYTIATYQSHVAKMQTDADYRNDVLSCELVICDEAHKSLGPKTQQSIDRMDGELDEEMTEGDEECETSVLENINVYASSSALKLGFTATPTLIEKSVEKTYKTLIAESSYSELVRAGILKKFKVKQVSARIKPKEVLGNIGEEQESKILEREQVYEQLLKAYKSAQKEIPEQLLGLASCANISECDRFSRIAESMGLRTVVVTNREYKNQRGTDPREQAEQFLLNGDRDIIVTVDKLKEGWNFKPLNAVILARATLSPANVLQPAGRASRMFGNQQYAYVFEAEWRSANMRAILSNEDVPSDDNKDGESSEGGKRTSRLTMPLTFADALYLSGERDISAVCEGWHGERMRYKKTYVLDENGEVAIDDIVCMSMGKFMRQRSGLNYKTLSKAIERGQLTIIGYALDAPAMVPVYRKSELENLPYVILSQKTPSYSEVEEKVNKRGEVTIKGKHCVALSKYSRAQEIGMNTLQLLTEEQGLEPAGYARSAQTVVQVYDKAQVDALLPKKMNENGEIVLRETECVGLSRFATNTLKMRKKTLEKAVLEAGIKPFGSIEYREETVEVYEKSQILELEAVKMASSSTLDENGEITVNDTICVGLSAFNDVYKINNLSVLKKKVAEAGITPIGKANSRIYRAVDIYPKDLVINLPYVQEKLRNVI